MSMQLYKVSNVFSISCKVVISLIHDVILNTVFMTYVMVFENTNFDTVIGLGVGVDL
jgi:hypothetical protein